MFLYLHFIQKVASYYSKAQNLSTMSLYLRKKATKIMYIEHPPYGLQTFHFTNEGWEDSPPPSIIGNISLNHEIYCSMTWGSLKRLERS